MKRLILEKNNTILRSVECDEWIENKTIINKQTMWYALALRSAFVLFETTIALGRFVYVLNAR